MSVMKLRSFSSGFKEVFKCERIKAGFKTQKGIAAHLHVSVDTVRNWEYGRAVPEIKTIELLCNEFGCDPDYLLGRMDHSTHDNQFICDEIGLNENSVQVLKKLKKNQVAMDVLNFLISDGELLSKIEKYFCSFTSDELLQEPYCYLPLDEPVPDYRLRLAEISESLPENRKRFVEKCDKSQKQTIIFDYIKDYLDYFGCDRILSGSAVMLSALSQGASGMRNRSVIKDIPDKDDWDLLDDFVRIVMQSQIALLPIQQRVIQDCLDSIGVDITEKMASRISNIRQCMEAFNSWSESEVSDDGAD